jgi:hypothetical protein
MCVELQQPPIVLATAHYQCYSGLWLEPWGVVEGAAYVLAEAHNSESLKLGCITLPTNAGRRLSGQTPQEVNMTHII